jgi:hypothetical protein
MIHSFPGGLYGVAATQGPNDRTNGIIYICDAGSTVVSTILFGWYGSTNNTVQYPDFIMDSDSIFIVWSEAPYGGIHASSLPLKFKQPLFQKQRSWPPARCLCYGSRSDSDSRIEL